MVVHQVGIVGCGVIGTRLAEAFDASETTTIRAVCDRVEEKAESMANEYDCRALTSIDRLVDLPEIDIVYVGIPPKHHASAVEKSLEAGHHVICEKPIAESESVGRELTALAQDSDQTTAINFPFRYTPGFREMQSRITAGQIGSPKRVTLQFRFPRWPREWQDVEWLEGREQGGPLREVGSHFLFGTQALFGDIVDIDTTVRYTAPGKYEESLVGTFLVGADPEGGDRAGQRGAVPLEEQIHGSIDILCGCAGPEENKITVEGTEGTLSLQAWRRLVANPGESDERVITDAGGETTRALVNDFVSQIEDGDGNLVSFEEATQTQQVVDEMLAGHH